MTFFIRRLVFVLSIMYMSDYLLCQIALQIAISLIILIFLLLWQPKKNKFENKKEIFNELTILVLIYFVLSFTGAEPDAEKRAMIGRCIIALSSVNIIFHLVLLIKDCILKIIDTVRRAFKWLLSKCKRNKQQKCVLEIVPQC